MKSKIHIGNIIIKTLKEKDFTIAWLARQVYCNESNFYKKLKNNEINIDLLFHISNVLHVDFFACYSEELQKNGEISP